MTPLYAVKKVQVYKAGSAQIWQLCIGQLVGCLYTICYFYILLLLRPDYFCIEAEFDKSRLNKSKLISLN